MRWLQSVIRVLQRPCADPRSSKSSAPLGSSTSSGCSSACLFAARISCRRNAPTAIKKAAHTKKGGVNAARSVSTPLASALGPRLDRSRRVRGLVRPVAGLIRSAPGQSQVTSDSRRERACAGLGAASDYDCLNADRRPGQDRQPPVSQPTTVTSQAAQLACSYFLGATSRPNVEKDR